MRDGVKELVLLSDQRDYLIKRKEALFLDSRGPSRLRARLGPVAHPDIDAARSRTRLSQKHLLKLDRKTSLFGDLAF